jgi:hypothetical protein
LWSNWNLIIDIVQLFKISIFFSMLKIN